MERKITNVAMMMWFQILNDGGIGMLSLFPSGFIIARHFLKPLAVAFNDR